MSYTRQPFDSADATWQDAASYTRPAFDSADAGWTVENTYVTGTLSASLAVPTFGLSLSADGEQSVPIEGTLAADLPVPSFGLSLTAEGHNYLQLDAYQRPAYNSADATWQGAEPYTRPAFDAADATFEQADRVYGLFYASLAVPQLPLSLSAAGERDRNWLYASLPPPALPLELRARERSIYTSLAISLAVPELPLSASLALDYISTATLAASLPPPAMPLALVASGDQDTAMTDGDGPKARGFNHQQMTVTANAISASQQQMIPTQLRASPQQQQADKLDNRLALRSTETWRTRTITRYRHAEAIPIQASSTAGHQEALRVPTRPTGTAWQQMIRLKTSSSVGHADTIKTRNRQRTEHQQAATSATILGWQIKQSLRTSTRLGAEWAQQIDAIPGLYWPWYGPPGLIAQITLQQCGDYTPRPLECKIVLGYGYPEQPPCGEPEPGQIIIPVRETYIVINEFSLIRASDSTPIPCRDFRCDIDSDSWTWSWSATIPDSARTLVQGDDPIEVIASLNGHPLRLIVESLSRSRKFGETWTGISGRGHTAWLAEPYSPIITRANSETRTAQQLILDALTENGAALTGWGQDIDWHAEDWTLPAGAWSYSGTYIDAAKRVAEAAGAVVQGHDTDKKLIVQPYYPKPPWQWATLNSTDQPWIDFVTLPEDACETEGIEWIVKPSYNAVWVAGGESGRLDLVKITGSAADTPAQTIVDPLATATAMTRQRGIRTLGDTGKQAHISLRLPIYPESGIIKPGSVVDYTENGTTRRGMVRSLSVDYSFPQAWQSIKVETHA
jgi:hypothetical protein